jgi:hypothetical protein
VSAAFSLVAATVAVLEIDGHWVATAVPETWKVLDAPAAMSPKAQVKEEPVIEQSGESSVQVPVGRESLKVTLLAVPTLAPEALDATIVHWTASPTETGPLPVLVTLTSGHLTVTLAVEELLPVSAPFSFVEVAVAVLDTMPQSLVLEVAETWTVLDPDEARVPNAQDRVPVVIEHDPWPVPPSIEKLRPGGSESLRLTPVAAPGPALATVIVNPTGSPADTDAASAVLVTETFGHWTVIVAVLEEEGPPLVEEAVAWLLRTPQSAGAVVPVTVT